MTPAWLAALPDGISLPRWFGSCSVLGSNRVLISPHRPDLNAYVERFHRSLAQECLQVHRPGTLAQVAELTEAFLVHYNRERPNQARSCGNHPPRVACQQFPTLPAVPETVVTSRWLGQIHKHAFARTIHAGGDLTINHQDYYVSRTLAGKPGHRSRERSREALRDLAGRRGLSSRSRSKGCMARSCLSRSM